MALVITQDRIEVMDEPGAGIVAGDAHALAAISYRQLDHWARQGWVTPSIDAGAGRSGRRLYSADDVVRLDLLRHLALARVNPAVAGPLVAHCEVAAGDIRMVWGPVGAKDPEQLGLRVVAAGEALAAVEANGAWVVYNPAPLRARLAGSAPAAAAAAPPSPAQTQARAQRRSA